MQRASRHIVSIAASCSLVSVASAQVVLDWSMTLDGPTAGDDDFSQTCAVDAAGNVYTSGVSLTNSTPSQGTIVTIARDASGQLSWSRNAAPGLAQNVTDIGIGPQGDVYVCGFVQYATANEDAFLIKYSPSGAQQWLQTYAGPSNAPDFAFALAFDANGDALLAGTSRTPGKQRDFFVVAYSPTGAALWERRIDGGVGGSDEARAISVLPSGEIVVAGWMTTATGVDAAVVELAPNGTTIWSHVFDGGGGMDDALYVLATTDEPRIVAAGRRRTTSTGIDYLAVELDPATGAQRWLATYDGGVPMDHDLNAVAIASDGTTWVTGRSQPTAATVRFDRTGAQLSATTWSNAAFVGVVFPRALILGDAGQAWLVASGDFGGGAVVQYDSSGVESWTWDAASLQIAALSAARAPNARLALAGSQQVTAIERDFVTFQLDLLDVPDGYCTAKTTSTGCTPFVSFTGNPSASSTSGFVVRASSLRNQKSGLLFYGTSGAAASPFQGGTLCVASPHLRTPVQSSAGSALPADDCSGSFALDMNAFASGALGGSPSPALQVAGTHVYCQFWGRDPGFAAPRNTMLSNALRYVVLP